MTERSIEIVLHPSVVLCWWLQHLPHADSARAFRERLLEHHRVRLIATDQLDVQVVEALLDDLRTFAQPLSTAITGMLYDDVLAAFGLLTRLGILQVVNIRSVARTAMMLGGLHRLPFIDALNVVLAEESIASQRVLLVADEPTYSRLMAVQADRPALRVVWLPEYV